MKKMYILGIIILTALSIYLFITTRKESSGTITADQAIALVKKTYPIYNDYPSDNLPRKTVEATSTADGWRVGMYIEGSGLPGILKADCFLVTSSGMAEKTGFFSGEGPAKSMNLVTCTPSE